MGADGVLGIDTATADVAVAVALGERPAIERRAQAAPDGRPRHASALLAEIEAAVGAAGGWERIAVIAVGVGPGAFTGLRVGIATARALGQGRGLPMVAVGSLAALARGIGEQGEGRPRLAVFDARREQVYAALYDRSANRVWGPEIAAPEALAERLAGHPGPPLAGGDGSLRFRRQLESAGVEVLPAANEAHRISARHLCALAAAIEPGPPAEIKPVYLRRPDAELWREQRDREPQAG